MVGGSSLLNGNDIGKYILAIGLALAVVYVMVGWFSTVINESEQGCMTTRLTHHFVWE